MTGIRDLADFLCLRCEAYHSDTSDSLKAHRQAIPMAGPGASSSAGRAAPAPSVSWLAARAGLEAGIGGESLCEHGMSPALIPEHQRIEAAGGKVAVEIAFGHSIRRGTVILATPTRSVGDGVRLIAVENGSNCRHLRDFDDRENSWSDPPPLAGRDPDSGLCHGRGILGFSWAPAEIKLKSLAIIGKLHP
jgi:hypothetical protein